ncbi:hypothetical protein VNI00_018174 [Paramarasmius palmivorus]|uniref:Uncharacterized protein n=1 Tax=Paramarasmius palmivorus TaxID=297713 RepID=A0AAW0B054_9AGAR
MVLEMMNEMRWHYIIRPARLEDTFFSEDSYFSLPTSINASGMLRLLVSLLLVALIPCSRAIQFDSADPNPVQLEGNIVQIQVKWHQVDQIEPFPFKFTLKPSGNRGSNVSSQPFFSNTSPGNPTFSSVAPGDYFLFAERLDGIPPSIIGQFPPPITVIPQGDTSSTSNTSPSESTDRYGLPEKFFKLPSSCSQMAISTKTTIAMPTAESQGPASTTSNTTFPASSEARSITDTNSESPSDANTSTPTTASRNGIITTTNLGIGTQPTIVSSRTQAPNEITAGSTDTAGGGTTNGRPSFPSDNSGQRSDIGAIIGGVIGGLVFVTVMMLGLLYLRRRRTKRNSTAEIFDKNKMVKERESDYPFAAIHSPSYREKSSTEERAAVMKNYSRDSSPSPSAHEATITASDVSEENSRTSRTDRQMEIEERIQQLQAQLITLKDFAGEEQMGEIREKIDRLNALKESDWALELSDERPPDMD